MIHNHPACAVTWVTKQKINPSPCTACMSNTMVIFLYLKSNKDKLYNDNVGFLNFFTCFSGSEVLKYLTQQEPGVEGRKGRKQLGFRCDLTNLTAYTISRLDDLAMLASEKSGRTASWRKVELLNSLTMFPKRRDPTNLVSLAKKHKNGSNDSQGRKMSLLGGTVGEAARLTCFFHSFNWSLVK